MVAWVRQDQRRHAKQAQERDGRGGQGYEVEIAPGMTTGGLRRFWGSAGWTGARTPESVSVAPKGHQRILRKNCNIRSSCYPLVLCGYVIYSLVGCDPGGGIECVCDWRSTGTYILHLPPIP